MADIFTDAGEAFVVDLMALEAFYVGWGTGAGTAAKTDTTLFTESADPGTRTAGTISQPAADTLRVVGLLTSGGAQTITNAGYFDAASAGNMIVKGDFTGIVLGAGDKIEFTMDLQFT